MCLILNNSFEKVIFLSVHFLTKLYVSLILILFVEILEELISIKSLITVLEEILYIKGIYILVL